MLLFVPAAFTTETTTVMHPEVMEASGVDWTIETGFVPWDLDEIVSNLEEVGTATLPLLDQAVRIVAAQVEVWPEANRIVLEEDSSGNWAKVADITAQMFTGVVLGDMNSDVALSIDAAEHSLAGHVETSLLLYSFASEGYDSSTETTTVSIAVRPSSLAASLGNEAVAVANPSATNAETFLHLAETTLEQPPVSPDGVEQCTEDFLEGRDDCIWETTTFLEDSLLSVVDQLPGDPYIPDALALSHGAVAPRCQRTQTHAVRCMQAVPYVDNPGEPMDSTCRIQYSFHMMHDMYDKKTSIHIEPQAIRKTGTSYSTNVDSHMDSFGSYLAADSKRTPTGTDAVMLFTGVDIAGVGAAWSFGLATKPFYDTGDGRWKGMFGVSQLKSQSGYDGSTEVAETAAHELAHIAGHSGHDNKCMDRSWYGSCKKYSVMYKNDHGSVKMDMRKSSADKISQHSQRHL